MTKNWYAIECSFNWYITGPNLARHWNIAEAWLFETMAEALPILEAHPDYKLIMVQVISVYHVIGVVG